MSAVISIPIKNHSLNHFDDLDDYSLMDIFDMLELPDLAKIVPLSPRFHDLIMNHYIKSKYRLHKREIIIIEYESGFFRMFYKDDGNSLSLITRQYDEMLIVLQTFGHILGYLDIKISSYLEGIQSVVNEHCSNAAQTITITAHSGGNSEKMMLSFLNATTIIVDRYVHLPNGSFRLDIAFPQMQKLVINGQVDLQQHYPHLTEVYFELGMDAQYLDPSELFPFIRLNPQLRVVKTPAFDSVAYLELLSGLPNLENLYLELVPQTAYTVRASPMARFRHVKNFTLDVDAYMASSELAGELLASIQFDQLESFSAYTRHFGRRDFLIDLMVKNTALRNVTMKSIFTVEQLTRLIEALPQLSEINLVWQLESLESTLNAFLEHVVRSNHSVQIVIVHFVRSLDITYDQLVEVVPLGWDVYKPEPMGGLQLLRLERSK